MVIIIVAYVIAFFFALNIGASGTAAAMGAAYGGGALKSRRMAVCIVALFAVLGANIGGYEVVSTLSGGIIPERVINAEITIIIIFSACLTLFISNRLGIPLSTSEVSVGSIVGVGLAFQQVYWANLLAIVFIWLLVPLLSLTIAFLLRKSTGSLETYVWKRFAHSPWLPRVLSLLLIAAGAYEAFSAGMNNIANAVAPLISAQIIDPQAGIWYGSWFLAIGALTLGGKVLETNGKKIVSLNLFQGIIVSFTSGSLVIIASLYGIPVPLTQATTMAILGAGSKKWDRELLAKPIVRKIIKIWIVSPIFSLIIAFTLMQLFIFQNHMFLLYIFLGISLFTMIAIHLRLRMRRSIHAMLEKE